MLRLHLFDSRRQIGPNLLHDGAGAALELVWGEDRSAQPGGDFEVPLSAGDGDDARAAPAAGFDTCGDADNDAARGDGTDLDPERVDRCLDAVVSRWSARAHELLAALGWERERCFVRRFAGRNQSDGPLRGATLALSAPADGLWTATEISEWAVAAATADLRGEAVDLPAAVERLAGSYQQECRRRSHLRALLAEAGCRTVTALADDRWVSLGTGTGALVLPRAELPPPEEVNWEALHDVPAVFITGTNGKSTTVRLLAAIGRAAGRCTGMSSTDWIRVNDEVVEEGDCAGPDGARRLLRDPRVELALCETARGGILRRGLVDLRAAAAIITNVAEDHLGQWGVLDLAGMLATKAVVAKLVAQGGSSGHAPLILNADDPGLLRLGLSPPGAGGPPAAGVQVAWFSLQARQPDVLAHVARGGRAAVLDGHELVLLHGEQRTVVLDVAALPAAWGGAARHNIANALAALLAADALGLPLAAMRAGLSGFVPDAAANPGRGNRFDFGGGGSPGGTDGLGGVIALADFAHNVHGMEALAAMLTALPARRRLLVLGQAGDRSDSRIRELVAAAWACRPERVIIKEQIADLRGRQPGEVPAVIEAELLRLGASRASLSHAASELEAVREALAWCRPGDVLALFLHSQRGECLQLLEALQARAWRPGEPLPA